MISGKEVQSTVEGTMSSRLVCKKCDTDFTFEEGTQGPMWAGIQAKVVMCPYCYTVYEIDVTRLTTTLLEDVTHNFPGIRNKAKLKQQEQRLVRCDVCHQMRKQEGFVCSRCGYVNWHALEILWGITVVLLLGAVFLRQWSEIGDTIFYLDGIFWLFGVMLLLFGISELVKAIQASRKK